MNEEEGYRINITENEKTNQRGGKGKGRRGKGTVRKKIMDISQIKKS